MLSNRFLTEACDIVIQFLNDRGLEPEVDSHFSEELAQIQSEERRKWLRDYVYQHTYWLLQGLLDQVYKLEACMTTVNLAITAVGEYVLLRSILEYSYRLDYLTVLDIGASERVKRSIEYSYTDLKAYEGLPSNLRSPSSQSQSQFLEEWYKEIAGEKKLNKRKQVKHVMDNLGGANEEWQHIRGEWPTDGRGTPINPVYQSGYAIWSAITHGDPWAIRHFGLTKANREEEDAQWFPGLDLNTTHKMQDLVVRLLQHSFGYSVQLMHRGGLHVGTMNRLEEVIARIQETNVADAQ